MTDPSTRSGRIRGYAEAVAAASLWGSSGIFAVHLFRLGLPPESQALLRPVVGVVFLSMLFLIRNPRSLSVDRTGLIVLCLGGAIVGIFQLAYQLSTDAVGVPSTVAMLYIAPAVVALGAGPLLGEWPTPIRILLLIVTLSGVWLSVLGADDVPATFGSAGVGWGLLAGLSYGGYTLFGRYASPRWGAVPTVFYSTLGSCIFLAATVPLVGGPLVLPSTGESWMLIIAFGCLTVAVAQFLFFDALSHIDAPRASMATAVEPVVAAILATSVLSQGLTPIGWVGLALVVAGVAGVGVTAARIPTVDGSA